MKFLHAGINCHSDTYSIPDIGIEMCPDRENIELAPSFWIGYLRILLITLLALVVAHLIFTEGFLIYFSYDYRSI